MLEQGVDILYKIFKIVSFDKVNAFADVNLLVCDTATRPSTVSSMNKFGIVCSWFHKLSSSSDKHAYVQYVLQTEAVTHNFVPLNSYICTLPFESFESIEVTLLFSLHLTKHPVYCLTFLVFSK